MKILMERLHVYCFCSAAVVIMDEMKDTFLEDQEKLDDESLVEVNGKFLEYVVINRFPGIIPGRI